MPTAGGANTRRAIGLAIDQASQFAEQTGESPEVTLLYVCVPADADPEVRARGFELLRNLASGYDYSLKVKVLAANDVVDGIVEESAEHDLVIIGATAERLFDQVLFGTIPERVAHRAPVTVIMVKRYKGPVRRWIRRTFSGFLALGERRRTRTST